MMTSEIVSILTIVTLGLTIIGTVLTALIKVTKAWLTLVTDFRNLVHLFGQHVDTESVTSTQRHESILTIVDSTATRVGNLEKDIATIRGMITGARPT